MRLVLVGAAFCAATSTLAGQAPAMRPGLITASAGMGSGSATFSCDACPSDMDAGVSWLLGLGVAVRSNLSLGVEASRWTKAYADSRGTADASLLFLNATAQWYPRASRPLFVKAGAGYASIGDDVVLNGFGTMDIASSGPSVVVGAGWHFALARGWSVTPYVDLNYALKGDQSVNGTSVGQKLGSRVLHFGIATTTNDLLRRNRPRPAEPAPMVVAVNQDSLDRAREALAADAARLERESEAARATIVASVYYELGKSDLRDDAKRALDEKLPILAANPDLVVRLVGHTDGRGTGEANRDLGQRRADVVREYFIAAGVKPERIELVTFGAERPLCQLDNEACWAQNRRVEFQIVAGGSSLRKP